MKRDDFVRMMYVFKIVCLIEPTKNLCEGSFPYSTYTRKEVIAMSIMERGARSMPACRHSPKK
jgi:hypothetical protein